jgi:hypothetical protein
MTDPTPQPSLDRLVRRLTLLIGAATQTLEGDMARVSAWYNEVGTQLRRYAPAAYLNGAGTDTLSKAARRAVEADIQTQLQFLKQFAIEIEGAAEWQAGWNARAAMYARSIQVPYWRGKTKLLPLPAMPGDGSTQCLTNCGCAWDVQEVGEDSFDAYWRRAKTDSCQGCVQREREWAPLQIREGVLL